jgi:hypothetical protein
MVFSVLNCSARELRRSLISTAARVLGQVVKDTGQPLPTAVLVLQKPFWQPLFQPCVNVLAVYEVSLRSISHMLLLYDSTPL